jgi:hypothetical protein
VRCATGTVADPTTNKCVPETKVTNTQAISADTNKFPYVGTLPTEQPPVGAVPC